MFNIGDAMKNTPVICDHNALWRRRQSECRQNNTIISAHRAAYCRSHAAAFHHSASSALPILILRFIPFTVYITLSATDWFS